MEPKLKHQEKDSYGSFVAWGIGFYYEYDGITATLHVINARQKKPLLCVSFGEAPPEVPIDFVRALEKATQINALIFSANKNIDLSDIFEEIRLKSILENCVLFAKHSTYLQDEQFEQFEESFCDLFEIKHLRIEQYSGYSTGGGLYSAELKTLNNNSIQADATSIHKVLGNLSELILRDLLSREVALLGEKKAHNLLSIASNLSVLSRILNKNFDPKRKIKPHIPLGLHTEKQKISEKFV